MSAPAPKKSKQNNGQAKPQQQQQQKPQQQGKQQKQQQQQGGKPQQQQQQQKPKQAQQQQPQAQQGKKDKKPQQQQQQGKPAQPPQQNQPKQGLSKSEKKKLKNQAQQAPVQASAPTKEKESKKRPLEVKEPAQDDSDDDAEAHTVPSDDSDDDNDIAKLGVTEEMVDKIGDVQEQLDAVERKGAKEFSKIEAKMAIERQPIFEKRGELLRTIPHIWQRIFETVDVFANILTDNDHTVLSHLEHVMIHDHAAKGFDVEFEFASNPIFSNKTLHINMKYPPESEDDDEDSPDNDATVDVTPVQWKDKSYAKTNADSWFVRFFNDQVMEDEDAILSLQYLKNHIWSSPLEALTGAFNDDDEDDDENDPIMMEDSDDDGDAPDLVPADEDEDEE